MAGQSDEPKRAAPSGGSLRGESQATVGEVLGLITHDLRNPLAALSSNVGFLQMVSEEMSEDAQEAVGDLLLSVEAMGRIIDSLELVGHDLGDRRAGAPSPLVVGPIVRALKASTERAAQSHNLTVTLDVGEHSNARFLATAHPFSHALTALIHNALTVAPSKSEVTLRVILRGDSIVFRVEDHGEPLSAEMRDNVGSAATLNKMKSIRKARYSRGLGLFMVARSAHNAGVEFLVGESTEGSALELVAPLVR